MTAVAISCEKQIRMLSLCNKIHHTLCFPFDPSVLVDVVLDEPFCLMDSAHFDTIVHTLDCFLSGLNFMSPIISIAVKLL